MNEEIRDLRDTLGVMATAMASLLAWAKEVERSGAVPPGTWDRAQKVVELGKLHDELVLLTETLETLNESNAPTLQTKLQSRVRTLQSNINEIQENLDGA